MVMRSAKLGFYSPISSNRTSIFVLLNNYIKPLALQFIYDTRGNTIGVFIPIGNWQLLKAKSPGLQKEEEKMVEPVLKIRKRKS